MPRAHHIRELFDDPSQYEMMLRGTYEHFFRKRLFFGDQQYVERLLEHGYFHEAHNFFLKKLYQWHADDPVNGAVTRLIYELERD